MDTSEGEPLAEGRTMIAWIIIGLLVWTAVALGFGIWLGKSIAHADRQEGPKN